MLVKESRVEGVLRLLLNKKNSLVKMIETTNHTRNENVVFSWEQTEIKELANEDLQLRMSLIRGTFGRRMRGKNRSVLIALDYFEALKYKKLIEEEIRNQEDNLFLNL